VALFAAFMIAGLTESWLRDKEIALLFWGVAGAAVRPDVAALGEDRA
jgi:hypothetical protein